MRAIVHKTKGKLDLRSLTIFGLNAKPNTDTPIGYFGTGLKYAMAVLARYNISVTIWIDGKKWTIEQDDTKFRDKTFRALTLKRHTLIPKAINLPFTTELGKNWEIWQAFRELECNTRDENGETFVRTDNYFASEERGHTIFVVEDERYVEEYYKKDTHFLPGGMTQQDSTETMQVFARKSDYIYYRGVRIYDLKEPTNNTYNFLERIELTEDRTAKYPWDLEMKIERYIANTKNKEVVQRAITAPTRTYERGLSYEYTGRSETFLNLAAEAGDSATQYVQSILRRDRPPEVPQDGRHWLRQLISAIDRGDYDAVKAIISDNKPEMVDILGRAATEREQEDGSIRDGVAPGVQPEAGPDSGEAVSSKQGDEVDDIPF
jgi:hypothetical protein